ncbi:hypothetical protein JCM10908_001368 [Rhodotorula pacifica]|uniref:uncharacterized protein n=1 Tax=Rhodotorula pacifica TaxID=1495444 RepID=UPI0031798294
MPTQAARPRRERLQRTTMLTVAAALRCSLSVELWTNKTNTNEHLSALGQALVNLWSSPFYEIARVDRSERYRATLAEYGRHLDNLHRAFHKVMNDSLPAPQQLKAVAMLLRDHYSFEQIARDLEWPEQQANSAIAQTAREFGQTAGQFATTLIAAQNLYDIPVPMSSAVKTPQDRTDYRNWQITLLKLISLDICGQMSTSGNASWRTNKQKIDAAVPGMSARLHAWREARRTQLSSERYAALSAEDVKCWYKWLVLLRERVRTTSMSVTASSGQHAGIAQAAGMILDYDTERIEEEVATMIRQQTVHSDPSATTSGHNLSGTGVEEAATAESRQAPHHYEPPTHSFHPSMLPDCTPYAHAAAPTLESHLDQSFLAAPSSHFPAAPGQHVEDLPFDASLFHYGTGMQSGPAFPGDSLQHFDYAPSPLFFSPFPHLSRQQAPT